MFLSSIIITEQIFLDKNNFILMLLHASPEAWTDRIFQKFRSILVILLQGFCQVAQRSPKDSFSILYILSPLG